MSESSPAQIFGNLLRTFRDEAGLSQQEVAERSLCSQPLISGLERGTKATKREQIDFIDHALGAKGKLLAVWPITAAGGASAERIADLEADATVIHDWENRVVSGLLQTRDYARAVAHSGFALANTAKIDAIVGKRNNGWPAMTNSFARDMSSQYVRSNKWSAPSTSHPTCAPEGDSMVASRYRRRPAASVRTA